MQRYVCMCIGTVQVLNDFRNVIRMKISNKYKYKINSSSIGLRVKQFKQVPETSYCILNNNMTCDHIK